MGWPGYFKQNADAANIHRQPFNVYRMRQAGKGEKEGRKCRWSHMVEVIIMIRRWWSTGLQYEPKLNNVQNRTINAKKDRVCILHVTDTVIGWFCYLQRGNLFLFHSRGSLI